jgi:uncharacterized membrane protein
MTYKEILQKEHNYINSIGGYSHLTEFNQIINDIQREKIRAYYKENKTCYLCKINDRKFTKYAGQKIYNFEYNYILPKKSKKIKSLLKKETLEYKKIFDAIEEEGGICLTWV